ncbi:putative pyruvate kinase [Helianthus annuus]|nr:putative pyruvate kinase [Helianthus annuus]KAJ0732823.1 putative pyruvate kinase [Helianthus annuus]
MAQVVTTKLLHTSFVGNQIDEKIFNLSGVASNCPISHRRRRRVLSVTARGAATQVVPVTPEDTHKKKYQSPEVVRKGRWSKPIVRRKTKIVCTIGPSTDTKEMIWKLAEAGMNVARLNMSHGDHASHQKVIDLVKEYNAQSKDNVIAIMLDTKADFLYFLLTSI